jgi:Saxitoxin biosynthesis operon protein SxtJ
MALIEINRDPTERQLNWFGALFALFLAAVGGMAWLRYGSANAAKTIWISAAIVALAYYACPPLRRPLYLGWSYVTFPIGWAISHLLLAATYYFIFTPVGLAMRLLGRDPMERHFDPNAESYWIEHNPGGDPSRYFRQF